MCADQTDDGGEGAEEDKRLKIKIKIYKILLYMCADQEGDGGEGAGEDKNKNIK